MQNEPQNKIKRGGEVSTIFLVRTIVGGKPCWRTSTTRELAEADAGERGRVYRWKGSLADLLNTGSLAVVRKGEGRI